MFECCHGNCGKKFSTPSNLNRHKRRDHDLSGRQFTSFDFAAYSAKCLECKLSFRYVSDLREHNQLDHKIPILAENFEFDDEEKFNIWRNELQIHSKTDFVKTAGYKKAVVYYNCSRTARRGKRAGKQGKRMPKLQGNKKLNFSCTCQIKVSQMDDGKLKVVYFKNHYGHEMEIEHTRLPKDVREDIAQKLANGVCVDRILNTYRDGIGIISKRSDYITRKDINNIRASYNLQTGKPIDEYYQRNLENWLSDCSKLAENPVILYEPMGIECENTNGGDFLLGIMNQTQKAALQRFGSGLVSMETSRNIRCSIHLTTLMIIDDSGESFPAAFLFSGRGDETAWDKFFRTIRVNAGPIEVAVFVSDVNDDCYNAWADVMGNPGNHIYSPWQVDNTWRENLRLISDLEKRCDVYKSLKTMQRERDGETFAVLLRDFIADDKGMKTFGDYFRKNFYNKTEKWAACFRNCCVPGQLMRLESMHKLVRKVWTEDGLDSGINAVMKILRERIMYRRTKETKRKMSELSNGTESRHRRASKESLERVQQIADNAWRVSSGFIKYIVVKGEEHDCAGRVQCIDCRICCCCYQCNCADFCLKSMICKHIHMVSLKERK